MGTNRHSRKRPNASDDFDQMKLDNAHAYQAFRYLAGKRQVLGPFDTVEKAVEEAAKAFAADDLETLGSNDKVRPFAIYAISKLYGFDHTTHYFNLERADALRRAGLGDNETGSG